MCIRDRRHAAHDRNASWPAIAFFIASTGTVLAPDNTVFAHARSHPSVHGRGPAAVWQSVEAGYDWRRQQLCDGWIEVNAAGTQADDRSDPPEHAYPPSGIPNRYDDYVVLTGWEQSD